MTTTNIYAALVAAGVSVQAHESDLYAEVTPVSRGILATYKHRANVRTFVDAVTGRLTYDIPFAFRPYWDAR